MNYILFDGDVQGNLLPFTYTRPVADIRVGILTIREKWEHFLGYTTTSLTQEYLSEKFPMVELENNIMINAAYLPTESLSDAVRKLQPNQGIIYQEDIVAFYAQDTQDVVDFDLYEIIDFQESLIKIENNWDIFQKNAQAIEQDFTLITQDRTSAAIPANVQVIEGYPIFIEESAKLAFVTLNASTGPIYIGKDTEIMEGSVIRGPFALCDSAQVKMGTKIYGATTVGPHSRVGGELSNVVIFGYTNKGHDGFLGNSVLGEWCNLGADTNCSNLKNNYSAVKMWNYELKAYEDSGLQFCGLMMGDHSKSGINTMFNTGSSVGVCCSIFGAGFPKTVQDNFTWGGKEDSDLYDLSKAWKTMEIVAQRRSVSFTEVDKRIYEHLFEDARLSRFEKHLGK